MDSAEDVGYGGDFNVTSGSNVSNQTLYFVIFNSIVCIIGVLGNALVIVVLVFYEKKKSLTDAFFVNLAVADFLFLCTFPFLFHYSIHGWILGEAMCKIVRGAYGVNLLVSIMTLTAITFDSFISTVMTTKTQRYQRNKHKWWGGMCALIWLISLLLAVPQLTFSTVQDGLCFEGYQEVFVRKVVHSFQLVAGIFIPFLAMLICCIFVLGSLICSRSSEKIKSIEIILTLVLVCIVTQLPINVTALVRILTEQQSRSLTASRVTSAIAILRACLNPIVHFVIHTEFKTNFNKMLKAFGLARGREEPDGVREERSYQNVPASTNAINMQQS